MGFTSKSYTTSGRSQHVTGGPWETISILTHHAQPSLPPRRLLLCLLPPTIECPLLLIYSCSFPRSRLLFAHPHENPFSSDRIIDFTHHHRHRHHHHHHLLILLTLLQFHIVIISIPAPASPTIPPALSVDPPQPAVCMEFLRVGGLGTSCLRV